MVSFSCTARMIENMGNRVPVRLPSLLHRDYLDSLDASYLPPAYQTSHTFISSNLVPPLHHSPTRLFRKTLLQTSPSSITLNHINTKYALHPISHQLLIPQPRCANIGKSNTPARTSPIVLTSKCAATATSPTLSAAPLATTRYHVPHTSPAGPASSTRRTSKPRPSDSKLSPLRPCAGWLPRRR
jgi:hypothetical protein